MTLGQRLQNARKEAGLSQEELAEQLGVSRQAVSKWENDSGYPEMEKMIRLSQIYQVSLDYLVGNEQEQEPSNEDISTKGWYVSHELAEGFLSYQRAKYKKIGICVLLVFISSALSFVEVYYNEYGGISDLLSTFLIMVVIILVINIKMSNNPYKKIWKKTLVFDDTVLKQLRVDFSENKTKIQIMLISGVFILLTGCMLFPELGEVLFPNRQYMYIWSALGDVLTGIGGYIAVCAWGIWRAYKVLTMNEEYRKGKDKK
ncbi:MAG: helix-turn-helix domain-containing protein [Lachnospiraceae bacterium]|nr:helix-turn-helix domain-containing protein [Lachnospiraceae bacterium]